MNELTKLSERVLRLLDTAFVDISQWSEQISPEHLDILDREENQLALMKGNYIEGYWRIRETTPLILAAIKRFNDLSDMRSVRFWTTHLAEEAGHDFVMHEDLCKIFGSAENVAQAMEQAPISPASGAIVGFFHWTVRHQNPHFLIILRFFLESFFDNMEDKEALVVEQLLGKEATKTLASHREADQEHVIACVDYVDEHFNNADFPALEWAVNMIGTCLIESQLWVANRLLDSQQP